MRARVAKVHQRVDEYFAKDSEELPYVANSFCWLDSVCTSRLGSG